VQDLPHAVEQEGMLLAIGAPCPADAAVGPGGGTWMGSNVPVGKRKAREINVSQINGNICLGLRSHAIQIQTPRGFRGPAYLTSASW
jgi:hypothetical protein